MNPAPRIAVAVPTYQRDQVLLDTLEQLFAQQPPADEILVIDQNESHPPAIYARLEAWRQAGRIRLIPHRPPNLPGARNRAIHETRCELILFIDDDVRLAPGFVEAHRRHFLNGDGVAAVAGRVTQPSERTSPLRRFALFGKGRWKRELDFRYRDMDSPHPESGIACFMGGNHTIRVDLAKALGGFDERFAGIGMREESDMALRVYEQGGLIVYEPAAHLIHLRAPLGGCRPRDECDTTGGESILHFALKHRRTLGVGGFLREVWFGLRIFLLSKASLRSPRVFLRRLGRLLRWSVKRSLTVKAPDTK